MWFFNPDSDASVSSSVIDDVIIVGNGYEARFKPPMARGIRLCS